MNKNCIDVTRQNLTTAFAWSLPDFRKKYGVTQTELGQYIGVSRQTISSIERGTVPLAWSTFLAMMLFFSINDPEVFREVQNNNFEKCIQELMKMKLE